MIRSHQPIPQIEIEPVVPTHLFMVHDVIGRGVEKVTERGIHQPSRMEFESGVSRDVEDDLPQHDESERRRMDGHRQCHDRKDPRFDHRFGRRESVRRPRRGIRRKVMHAVEQREEPPVMHQPMGPIEVGVVQENRADHASEKPAQAALGNLPVHLGVTGPGQRDGPRAHGAEDHQRHQ